MGLFQLGDFVLRSGAKSRWRIECDVLTLRDWEALALMAAEILPFFSAVVGVPQGGLPFADELRHHTSRYSRTLLVAEDVVTTGGSMVRYLEDNPAQSKFFDKVIGVCVFARGPCPDWVTPLFQMPRTE